MLQTFTNACRSDIVSGFTFAFVTVGSVDTFAISANVRPKDALVNLAQVAGFLTQLSVRIYLIFFQVQSKINKNHQNI